MRRRRVLKGGLAGVALAVAALMCGAIGWFAVLRGETYAAHTLADPVRRRLYDKRRVRRRTVVQRGRNVRRRLVPSRDGFQNPRAKGFLVEMTNCRGESIGSIDRQLFRHLKKGDHHPLHLLLACAPVTNNRQLDLGGSILMNVNPIVRGRQQRHPTGLAELEGALRVAREEHAFQANAVRFVIR